MPGTKKTKPKAKPKAKITPKPPEATPEQLVQQISENMIKSISQYVFNTMQTLPQKVGSHEAAANAINNTITQVTQSALNQTTLHMLNEASKSEEK
jgi:hypothetical protein